MSAELPLGINRDLCGAHTTDDPDPGTPEHQIEQPEPDWTPGPLPAAGGGCMLRRMPRMQVYLPDELYRAVKERGLPASELLQEAVRAELRRQELLAETDRYVDELTEEVGAPSPRAVAHAEALLARMDRRPTRKSAV